MATLTLRQKVDQLVRQVAQLKADLGARDQEIERLGLKIRTLDIDRRVAEHEAKCLAEVVERDRMRVQAETATHAGRVAKAERSVLDE